jgi:excisionase family DNA binding protein
VRSKTTQRKTIEMLTPGEVAERLKISVYSVRRWIKQGELPAYRVGRAWRISTDDLAQWLSKRQKHERA